MTIVTKNNDAGAIFSLHLLQYSF